VSATAALIMMLAVLATAAAAFMPLHMPQGQKRQYYDYG
jgi:hypothetical protein